jgi:Domain of unknown function (DUF4157)
MRNERMPRLQSTLRPVPARKPAPGRAQAFGSSADTMPVHDAMATPGHLLDNAARAAMELRFGYDVTNVRVHTDDQAAQSAQSIGALSYTVASDIAFAPGQYAPVTPIGRQILAHELAHVAQ